MSNTTTNSTLVRTFRKGLPVTARDEQFAKAVKRQFSSIQKEAPAFSMAAVSRLLGFHSDYLRRVASLTERPSRQAAETIAVALEFTPGQMKRHSSYFKSLPNASRRAAESLEDAKSDLLFVQALIEESMKQTA